MVGWFGLVGLVVWWKKKGRGGVRRRVWGVDCCLDCCLVCVRVFGLYEEEEKTPEEKSVY